jgi:hypothetical protein
MAWCVHVQPSENDDVVVHHTGGCAHRIVTIHRRIFILAQRCDVVVVVVVVDVPYSVTAVVLTGRTGIYIRSWDDPPSHVEGTGVKKQNGDMVRDLHF